MQKQGEIWLHDYSWLITINWPLLHDYVRYTVASDKFIPDSFLMIGAEENFNSKYYCEVLEKALLPQVSNSDGDWWIYVHDNTGVYCMEYKTTWMEEKTSIAYRGLQSTPAKTLARMFGGTEQATFMNTDVCSKVLMI